MGIFKMEEEIFLKSFSYFIDIKLQDIDYQKLINYYQEIKDIDEVFLD